MSRFKFSSSQTKCWNDFSECLLSALAPLGRWHHLSCYGSRTLSKGSQNIAIDLRRRSCLMTKPLCCGLTKPRISTACARAMDKQRRSCGL